MLRCNAMFVALVSSLFIVVAENGIGFGNTTNEKQSRPEECQWSLPVVVQSGSSAEAIKIAHDLAAAFGQRGVAIMKGNPVCAFWIEVGWKPNPGEQGYVIVVQPGGAYIRATDEAQLQAGVAELKKKIKIESGRYYVPTGMMTNYQTMK